MAETMLGIFSNREMAENAIAQLEKNNYDVKNMSIIMKESEESKKLAQNTGAHVGSGVATGAATGAILGGIAGILIGIGAIAIPGVGALLVGGPIAAALGLTGVAATTTTGVVTGALAGGIVGGLVSLGVPEERARTYEERINHGGILLAVPTLEGDAAKVQSIYEKNGASDIQGITLPPMRKDKYHTGRFNTDDINAHHDTRDDDTANTAHVQKYLRHADYPASKNDLLDVAEKEGADDEVMHTLKDLPNKKFEDPNEVNRAIGRHQ